MNSMQRRDSIKKALEGSAGPVSAAALAKQFEVSRQVIVGDIALLRASGCAILATPRGYVFSASGEDGFITRTIACSHKAQDLEKEIYAIVDHGGVLVDVIVEHPIYGQLTGQLNIFSRFDADEFIATTRQNTAMLLSNLTDGVHLHTIRCKDAEACKRILTALEQAGVLLTKN